MTKTTPRKPKAAKPEITARLVNSIIQRVANGETLTAICRDEGMPDYRRVWDAIHRSSSLRAEWDRARETRANRWAEEMTEIAEDGTNDYIEREGKRGTFIALNEEHVRRSQLRIDTRKWLLARALPARFGDRVEQVHSGAVQHEHTISAKMLDSLAILRARLPAMSTAVPGVIDVTPHMESVRVGKG
jgi:hypothetical protein